MAYRAHRRSSMAAHPMRCVLRAGDGSLALRSRSGARRVTADRRGVAEMTTKREGHPGRPGCPSSYSPAAARETLAGRGRVLSGQLWRGAFLFLLLALQTRVATPG